jgi:outer membrane immunogenic protein
VDYSWQGNSGAFRGDNGENGNDWGYVAGVGFDFKVSERMILGVEYLYINVGDADFQSTFSGEAGGVLAAFGNAASGGTIARGSKDDFDFQAIRFNESWMF